MRLAVRSSARTLALLLLASIACVACGDGDRPAGDRRDEPAPRAGAEAEAEAGEPALAPRRRTAACTPAEPGPVPAGAAADAEALDTARAALDGAVAAATASGHRFSTRARVRVRGGLSARARLVGRRLPDGTSAAQLRWEGAASIVLPDAELRIVADRIHARELDGGAWRDLGSASGVALDVGRELFDHPFLLETVGVATSGTPVTLAAPAQALRDYAGTERRGLVTELLVPARSLRIAAQLRRGRLVGDAWQLATTLPAELAGPVGGGTVTVQARTTYCPLRDRDRAPITAPTTTA